MKPNSKLQTANPNPQPPTPNPQPPTPKPQTWFQVQGGPSSKRLMMPSSPNLKVAVWGLGFEVWGLGFKVFDFT